MTSSELAQRLKAHAEGLLETRAAIEDAIVEGMRREHLVEAIDTIARDYQTENEREGFRLGAAAALLLRGWWTSPASCGATCIGKDARSGGS